VSRCLAWLTVSAVLAGFIAAGAAEPAVDAPARIKPWTFKWGKDGLFKINGQPCQAVTAAGDACGVRVDPEILGRTRTKTPGKASTQPASCPAKTTPTDAPSVKADVSKALWVFVDAWQTIGPFPNPGRRNIDTKFPPQTVQNLDASYQGKDGKKITWKPVMSSSACVTPADADQYAVFYALTELHFDKPCQAVIALGADDCGKVWVNDELIWNSGRMMKTWRPDEVYQRVCFRKGSNKILFRLENGYRACGLSLIIRLPAENEATTEQAASPRQVVLGVDEDGRFYVDGKKAEHDAVRQAIRKGKQAGARFRIHAENSTPYASVVELVNLCAGEGVKDLKLHTQKEINER
jgi:biopolymer transport protein ExbD